MNRAFGIPAAVVILIGFPVLVSQAAEEPAEPPAQEAALTINLEGEEGAGEPYKFLVSADGPPPAEAAQLHDSSGRYTGTVEAATDCEGEPRVAFPATGKPWCLQLTDVDEGHELAGSIAAEKAQEVGSRSLKLTVNRRDEFIDLPLAVLLIGIVLGAAAALVKPALKKPIRRTVLGTLLKENHGAAGPDRIDGLTEFARARLATGEDIDAVIEKVATVRSQGPAQAVGKRAELIEGLKQVKETIGTLPLAGIARKEAAREDHTAADFFDAEGKRKPHPAAELLEAVDKLAEYLEQMEEMRTAINALPAEHQTDPAQALTRAELVAREAETLTDVRRVADLLTATRDEIETARAKRGTPRRLRRAGGAPEPVGGLPDEPVAPLSLEAPELGGSELGKTKTKAWLLTIAVAVGALVLAIVTVKTANYDPKLTFSSFGDYFALFTASLGSAAAGALLLLLGFWSPLPIEDE